MGSEDEIYFLARAVEEEMAAQDSPSEPARDVHGRLAAMYRQRIASWSREAGEWPALFSEPCRIQAV